MHTVGWFRGERGERVPVNHWFQAPHFFRAEIDAGPSRQLILSDDKSVDMVGKNLVLPGREQLEALSYQIDREDWGETVFFRSGSAPRWAVRHRRTSVSKRLIPEVLCPFLRAATPPVNEAVYIVESANTPQASGISPRLGPLTDLNLGATLVLAGASVAAGPLRIAICGLGVDGAVDVGLSGFHPGLIRAA